MKKEARFQKLTAQEINELSVDACQRILALNSNMIVDKRIELIDAMNKKLEADKLVNQLKMELNAITEQNRALQGVIKNGGI